MFRPRSLNASSPRSWFVILLRLQFARVPDMSAAFCEMRAAVFVSEATPSMECVNSHSSTRHAACTCSLQQNQPSLMTPADIQMHPQNAPLHPSLKLSVKSLFCYAHPAPMQSALLADANEKQCNNSTRLTATSPPCKKGVVIRVVEIPLDPIVEGRAVNLPRIPQQKRGRRSGRREQWANR